MKLTKPGQLRSFAAYPQCSTGPDLDSPQTLGTVPIGVMMMSQSTGAVERLCVYLPMLWVGVFAAVLRSAATSTAVGGRPLIVSPD
jgi:hypothetical protein